MKERVHIASILIITLMMGTAQAQIVQLGRMPAKGKVKQVGLLARFMGGSSCDAGCAGCADPSCGAAATCGAPEPGCGVADLSCADPSCGVADPGCGLPGQPSCGLAGGILNRFRGRLLGHLGGDPGCGLPGPSCGSAGLGYSGGFGVCGGCNGGSCDACGVGGYFGRNLHPVDPCACGGTLFGDAARGFLSFFDRAVGTLMGSFFGGLQAASCHASGSFAALKSASTCGLAGCSDGSCDGCSGGLAPGGCALGSCGDPLGCSSCDGCDSGCASCTVGGAPAEGYVTESYAQPGVVSYPATSYPTESHSNSVPVGDDIYLPPPSPPMAEPTEATPVESSPSEPAPMNLPSDSSPIDSLPLETTPTEAIDPFVDDPMPLSQTRNIRQRAVAGGFRLYRGGNPRLSQPQQRTAGYQFVKPVQQAVATANPNARVAPPAKQVPAVRTADAQTPLQHRYLQHRRHQASLRR